jgi:ATP-dependent Lon protease
VPFDLSTVMFIGTANYMEPVPPALRDRMEVIELPGYTEFEKLNIAKKYLVPRQLTEHGLTRRNLTIKDETILEIIHSYTREAGVRNLERNIAAICRAVATDIAKNRKPAPAVTKKSLAKILGPAQFESELALRTGIPGVATALAFTPVGGELLFIESASMPGKGRLQLTGHIGDVMKESAQTAFSVVKANAKKLSVDPDRFKKFDYHIHVPAGAVPKDGPSAGIAMCISLISLLLNKSVRPDVAMTGEITLRGLVLPIGGLKEKILAAKQAGIKTVILPDRNKKDLPDVPREAKKALKFKLVKNIDEALKIALNTAKP